ncbi:MAG: DUF6048 family protein [Paludibacteraceae bacterium]|nr:DUF6048 family protein [Paludibacteraceae bacterium]
MMRRGLMILAMLAVAFGAVAQKDSVVVREKEEDPNYERPVYQGFSAHVDLLTPAMNLIFGKVYGTELTFDVNLYNRLFPLIEVGYGDVSQTLSSHITYKTHAPYLRIGMNYGILRPITKAGKRRLLDCYPYVGARYGMAFMDYDYSNVEIRDEYWGGSDIMSYSKPFVYSGWLEIVAGVRMNLAAGFTMGWAFKFRTAVHTSAETKAFVWYIPGYGKSDGSSFTFSYTIGYTYKVKKVRERDGTGMLTAKKPEQK